MIKSKMDIKNGLFRQLKKNGHLIGVPAGSGMAAKSAEQGGADFILAWSTGRLKLMGAGSLAGYLPYSNSNELVMKFATKEIIPIVKHTPVFFGLCATDPTIHLPSFIDAIKKEGFAGINNFPSIGLIDGAFRESLENQGISYDLEVEAIRIANEKGLLTAAFVFNEEQALKMSAAGADIICFHFGLSDINSRGSIIPPSLYSAKMQASRILDVCDPQNGKLIKMICGGPLKTPVDLQYMYDQTNIMGYIGETVLDYILSEQAVYQATKSLKESKDFHYDELIQRVTDGMANKAGYIDFVKEYIALHYMDDISLNEIADKLKLSRSYLSTLFKKVVGVSFTDYLIEYRLNRASDILQKERLPLSRVAEMVGYPNYAQFSKIFKKHKGMSPAYYAKTNITTKK